MSINGRAQCGALRQEVNKFKVDGLTRALTRQLYILYFIGCSSGFIVFLNFSLVFLFNRAFPISPLGGPPGVRSAPRAYLLAEKWPTPPVSRVAEIQCSLSCFSLATGRQPGGFSEISGVEREHFELLYRNFGFKNSG